MQASTLAQDDLDITFIYSNKTKDDILIKDEIDKVAAMNNNLKVFHTLTRHDDVKHGEWKGLKGRISEQMIKECGLPEPSPETLICYCGPAGFNKSCE